MFTKIEIRPVVGSPLEINTQDGSGNHLYPCHEFEIETQIDTHEFKKMAAAGEWPTFDYPGAMTVHAEGHVIGFGGTPSNDYVTKRIALLNAVLPGVATLTQRYHAVLRIRMDGMSEDADARVKVVQQSIPMEALFPSISEFIITWTGFTPWFTGVSSSTKYLLG